MSDEVLRQLLEKASRAPSGGNLQPWRVFVINGDTMPRFLEFLAGRQEREAAEYAIYPKDLSSPYRDSRFKVGEDMYALLGIGRDDKPARFAHLARNFSFFDAPAAFFCFVDRQMGPPQWSDLGMFLQTFMLLAEEAGLSLAPKRRGQTDPFQWQSLSAQIHSLCCSAVWLLATKTTANRLINWLPIAPLGHLGQIYLAHCCPVLRELARPYRTNLRLRAGCREFMI